MRISYQAFIKECKQSIYQDWKDGEITHSDYRHMSEDYERQISTINTVSDNLTAEQAELQNSIDTGSKVRTTHFCSLQHKFLVT